MLIVTGYIQLAPTDIGRFTADIELHYYCYLSFT